MSIVLTLGILAFVVRLAFCQNEVTTYIIEQRLDHYDSSNNRKWQMRYMANGRHHQTGGPIFIILGGQNEIMEENLLGGLVFDIAREHKGYMFHPEHRYYGHSHPTNDLCSENLEFLTMKQAVGDLAHLIRTIKGTIPSLAKSKVILAGCSYAGGMAVWTKYMYPNLVNGVWASSPVLFGILDFSQFHQIVGEAIRSVGGDECYDRIKRGTAKLEAMMTKVFERDVVDMLNLCPGFDTSNQLDVWSLFNRISVAFESEVMAHTPGSREINKLCEKCLCRPEPLDGLITYLRTKFRTRRCTDVTYKALLDSYSDLFANIVDNPRLYKYQTCNEFGWYPTSNPSSILAKVPLSFYTKSCTDAFGQQFTETAIRHKIDATKSFYEHLTPQADKIIVTHGELDPWKAVGLLPNLETEFIPMHGHCTDLESISSADATELRAVKEKIKSSVREWIIGLHDFSVGVIRI